MGIFGFIKGRAGRHIKHRKTRVDRLKRITEEDLLNIAGKNPEVMATVLGKYCDIWVHDDDGVEAIKQNIVDIIYRRAARKILTNKRRELDNLITGIIDRVIPGSNKPSGEPDKAGVPRDLNHYEKNSPLDVTRGYRTLKQGIEYRPSLLSFLEGLASVVAQAKLAGNQTRRGGVDSREKIYVVRLGGRTVEMTESDYRNHINRQKGVEKASAHNPGRLPSVQPAEKDGGPSEVQL